ncbi:hypothetical protein HID58_037696 [Brassica napus]|uniref:Uncharacterized protein n=2 Tax=Brassica TaxID=3705 RepID=A0ABQ8BM43_BRANA|nr:hypothetical protein HID58_037696 [Brassica napus]
MATTTSGVYIHVIEDVVSKVREEFINNGGPGESVLSELQGIWETKMMQAGVLSGPIDRSLVQRPTPGGGPLTHDLNVPYEGTEEYETPTAEMLFPPTPLQTPLPGTADNSSLYNIPTGSSDYNTPGTENGSNADTESMLFIAATAFSMDKLNPRLDVNVAYEPERGNSNPQFTQDLFVPPSGKRKRDDSSAQYQNGGYIPQQDGARDAMPKANLDGNAFCITFVSDRKVPRDFTCSSSNIPQVDGPMPDAYDEMLSTPNIYSYQGPAEDFNDARTPAPNEIQTSTPVAVQNDIIEDDDDDELDDLESGEDMNTQHLVLAQFDKVTRTKSRWKCNLKNGIMHINDKDILFNKALGEFDF